jgi:hypothetical protein
MVFLSLSNDTFSTAVASNKRMVIDNELEKTWKE